MGSTPVLSSVLLSYIQAMENTLFQPSDKVNPPFAELFRPRTLDEMAGQSDLLSSGAPFRMSLETGSLGSFILWGPPGCGKTTLALIVAGHVSERFVRFSAVTGGVADVRRIVAEASSLRETGRGTILFVDEIHRFSRSQQDAFLPHVENGTIRLVGATTENPSFTVNAPLLSRCSVHVLKQLSAADIQELLFRVVSTGEYTSIFPFQVEEGALKLLSLAADGDARRALNLLEQLTGTSDEQGLTEDSAKKLIQNAPLLYDRSGEEHYNLISALHKSMRSSDPDAALYWLGRMMESGEDPLYIGRRIVRFATEDIGLADPSGLTVAMRAVDSYRFLGSPEGDLALAEAVVYLCMAPKSNSIYKAWKKTVSRVKSSGSLPVPLHLRNAPTGLMKELGYGSGYQYAHDVPGGTVTHHNLPAGMENEEFYQPGSQGREAGIRRQLAEWKEKRSKARKEEGRGNGKTSCDKGN